MRFGLEEALADRAVAGPLSPTRPLCGSREATVRMEDSRAEEEGGQAGHDRRLQLCEQRRDSTSDVAALNPCMLISSPTVRDSPQAARRRRSRDRSRSQPGAFAPVLDRYSAFADAPPSRSSCTRGCSRSPSSSTVGQMASSCRLTAPSSAVSAWTTPRSRASPRRRAGREHRS